MLKEKFTTLKSNHINDKDRVSIIENTVFISVYVILISFDYIWYFNHDIVIAALNKLPKLISYTINRIDNLSFETLISCSILTTMISQIINNILLKQSTVVYNVSYKIYSRFYGNNTFFYYVIVCLISSIVFNSHSTLLWIIIFVIFKTISTFVNEDYRLKVKNGIKKGYCQSFILIEKEKKKEKINDREKLLMSETSKLLKNLIIYYKSLNCLDDIDSINFNLEVIKCFYRGELLLEKQFNCKKIRCFISQIKDSIDILLLLQNDKNSNNGYFNNLISYYIDDLLKTYTLENQTQNDENTCQEEIYLTMIISLFFIVLENETLNYDFKCSILQKIQNNFLVNCNKFDYFQIIVYIILFWKFDNKEDIIDIYFIAKPYCIKYISIEKLSDDFVEIIYRISLVIIRALNNYSKTTIDFFKNNYLIYLNYVGDDLIMQYYLYEQEIG